MAMINPTSNRPLDNGRILPDGTYRCLVARIELDQTRSGDEWWRLRLGVVDGPHHGRALFDDIYFSERALPRAIHFCQALGLKLHGSTEVTPQMCQGRECLVTIHSETYVNRDGQECRRNVVDYDGYAAVPAVAFVAPPVAGPHEDLPF